MDKEKCCGTCKYNRHDWVGISDDYYCGNSECENYGYNTAYLDTCEEWEER